MLDFSTGPGLLGLYRLAVLEGIEPSVEAARSDELLVGSFFCDAAVFDNEDLVYILDQAQLVSDDEGGAASG
jgi:hypothetical protein